MKSGDPGQGRTLSTRARSSRSIESLMTWGAHWACHGEEWGTKDPGGLIFLHLRGRMVKWSDRYSGVPFVLHRAIYPLVGIKA